MKKILAILLCVMLICITPVVAFAEDGSVDSGEISGAEAENSTPGEGSTTEGENSGLIDDVNTPDAPADGEAEKTITEQIKEWIVARLDDIAVVVTLIMTIIYNVRKHKTLSKLMGTLNNNAITIAENSKDFVGTALTKVESASGIVSNYTDEMTLLLAEIRKNAEEKQSLEEALFEVRNYLKTAKLANIEFADELAELLVLANIPNSKKDDIYSRHRAAVEALAEAEHTEVKEDVGEEA